ncbi:MAG: DUF5317 family protein [Anaerolineales bacterium]
MILLFPIVLGLAFGFLRGGRPANLAALPVRHAWLPLAAAGLQLGFVFFSHADLGVAPPVRVGVLLATYGGLIGFLVLNRRLPGAVFLLVGASLNAAVMAANGGYMPITPEALARSGHEGQIVTRDGWRFVYGSKDIVLEAQDTRLGFLSDVFGIPEELPFSATFSLGDVLIGVGAALLIARGMWRRSSGSKLQAPSERPQASSGQRIAGSGQGVADRGPSMKSHAILHRLIGRALTDRRFREALLRSPREAIGEYPFTPQERELIASLRATSLEEFSRQLDERGPGRSAVEGRVLSVVEGPALSVVEGTDPAERAA